jgi:UDPglucose 6-dehydrogenase
VTAVGRTQAKADSINAGKSPIFEEGLDDALAKLIASGKFSATTDLAGAVSKSEVTFICVGTPSAEDGSIDLTDMARASEDIGKALKEKKAYHTVVVKSTVVPGTTEGVVIPSIEALSGKRAGQDFGVCMNPEFLREGKALEDFMKPDRVVIGELDRKSGDVMHSIYSGFSAPIVRTKLKTAEMIKYASNSFLATKISFINEIANMCKRLGIDVYDVARGMGLDRRIGTLFLNAGAGFGGSCFPKDVSALISLAREKGAGADILETVMAVNERQKRKVVEILKAKMDVRGKRIAVLGLAFKDGTDDIRDAPSIEVIKELLDSGASVAAYDPKAGENMRKIYPGISYYSSAGEALQGADACLIMTEWPEFRSLTDKDFSAMKGKIIIEGRKMLDRSKVGNFEGVCW